VKLFPLILRKIFPSEVFDITGSLVMREENISKNINIGNLNAGVYHIKLTYKDGSLVNSRFIKI